MPNQGCVYDFCLYLTDVIIVKQLKHEIQLLMSLLYKI